ncbi:type I polyketide synthase [Streptomyces sp. NPDC090442]|uniref:type I polyketide synthase n=1 Tax=Streptomyces sp. NPDC090442 TaxID=3365962 RepID=UPI0038118709
MSSAVRDDHRSHLPTLVHLLRAYARGNGDHVALRDLPDGETETEHLTYAELDRRARCLAADLQRRGLAGERVLLLLPSGTHYVIGMLGCLYAAAIPVPLNPPTRGSQAKRIEHVLADCGPTLALLTSGALETFGETFRRGDCDVAVIDQLALPDAESWTDPELDADDLAYLQYTSGSTSDPRGVMVSHGNLLHQLDLWCDSLDLHQEDVHVTWLPLFHDLGLIAGLLAPLRLGGTTVMMPPAAFVQHPLRWLSAISRYRGTVSFGPNFALELCRTRIEPEERTALDLSSWRVAAIGAEPVRADSLEGFADTFGPCGFRLDTFRPGYGMAEATLVLTIRRGAQPLTVLDADAAALSEGRLTPAPGPDARHRRLVANGPACGDTDVVIVDPQSHVPVPDGREGEVWVRGRTVAGGYWQRPAESAATFGAQLADGSGPFLRTGDLGALRDGDLYITGRRKDLIVIRGRNYYPQDIETTVADSHPALARGRGAAFPVESDGEERLVVIHEIRRTERGRHAHEDIVAAVRQAVAEEHGIGAEAVVLLRPASLPVTTSGKVRRRHCRHLYATGGLTTDHIWHQNPPRTTEDSPGAPEASHAPATVAPQRRQEIVEWLRDRVAHLTGTSGQQVDVRAPLGSHGLDSVSLTTVSGELQRWLGITVDPVILFRYPTIERLAEALTRPPADEPASRPAPDPTGPPSREPLAIVGMAGTFPGAASVEEFWELLVDGRDAVAEVPAARWPADRYYQEGPPTPDRMNTRWGGFVDGVDGFDAAFFGISATEARNMDPQQRLVLTTAWRALEDAGIAPDSLAGSNTGVFVGISSNDYRQRGTREGAELDAYTGTGTALSLAANRLSYFLDLHGPSFAVDTACSSSLVALHQACLSLRLGECDTALVAGVNLLLDPDLTVAFSQAGMMSPEGRCKTFDASADGYVRGEGCGVVVLRRTSTAHEANDRIRALVRGTAVNQDGQSNTLTAPNALAQQAVITRALADAGLPASWIGYVEAHGTGTSLGDPIEIGALNEVYGSVGGQPLHVGSVKTNIGHLEAAAGIAGLIKVVLSLEHHTIPAHLHLRELNPYIQLDGTRTRIPDGTRDWAGGDHPRAAGVSSFGFGGTNAHAIVEEAPGAQRATPDAARSTTGTEGGAWHLLPVSAKNDPALRTLATSFADLLEQAPHAPEGTPAADAPPFAELCGAAGARRQHHAHRLAILARCAPDAAERLRAFDRGEEDAHVSTGLATGAQRPRAGFLFPGQGSQQIGMAKEFHSRYAAFREAADACDEIVRAELGVSLLPTLCGSPGELVDLTQMRYAQPSLFTVEYALATTWQACGVRPDHVLGHSLGEYAAACVAGILDLPDALHLVMLRSRLMQDRTPPGAMYAVHADAPQALIDELHASEPETVAVAAFNGPHDFTLSGDATAAEKLAGRWTSLGAKVTRLNVTRASHSPLMAGLIDEFRQQAEKVTYHPARIPLICNLTGKTVTDAEMGADYWLRQIQEPVRFADGITTLAAQGCRFFIEMGPDPVLSGLGQQTVTDGHWLPSAHRDDADDRRFLRSLGEWYAHGGTVDWAGLSTARGGTGTRPPEPVPLPPYPLRPARHWYRAGRSDTTATATTTHPLLGSRLELAGTNGRWYTNTLTADRPWYAAQHRVLDTPVLPAAAMVEWSLAALREAAPTAGPWTLEGITFNELVPLHEDRPTTVQALVEETGAADAAGNAVDVNAGARRVRCFVREADAATSPWTECATVTAASPGHQEPGPAPDTPDALAARLPQADSEAVYRRASGFGVEYGPAFRGLTQLWSDGNEALARIEATQRRAGDDAYALHPAALDACFHIAASFLTQPDASNASPVWLPAAVDRITVHDRLTGDLWCHARWHGTAATDNACLADLDILSTEGKPLATIEGLRLRAVSRTLLPDATLPPLRRYTLDWRPIPGQTSETTDNRTPQHGTWLIVTRNPETGRTWRDELARAGSHPLLAVTDTPAFVPTDPGEFHIPQPESEDAFAALLTAAKTTTTPLRGVILDGAPTTPSAPQSPSDTPDHHPLYDLAHATLTTLRSFLPTCVEQQALLVLHSQDTGTPPESPGSDTARHRIDIDIDQTVLTGFAKAVVHEYPDLKCVQVDSSATDGTVPLTPLLRRVDQHPGSGHLAVRNGRWYEARLREAALPEAPTETARIRPDATYLITGGWGGIGRTLAQWLVRRGATALALAGRRPPHPVPAWITALRDRGVRVELCATDVADTTAVQRLIDRIAGELPPLHGVFHAAGSTDDGRLEDLDHDRLTKVLDPKIRGAWNLHHATTNQPLDLFVVISSMAALLGSPGQANYVVANAVLDALAHRRAAAGLPALSVAWGPWADDGMVTPEQLDRLARTGMHGIRTREASDAFPLLLTTDSAHFGLAKTDWGRFTAATPRRLPYTLLADLEPTEQHGTTDADADRLRELTRLVLEEPEAGTAAVISELLRQVSLLVGMDAHEREELRPTFPHVRLNEIGLDSLMAVQLRNRLLSGLSANVPTKQLFGAATVSDIADLVSRQITLRAVMDTDEPTPATTEEETEVVRL